VVVIYLEDGNTFEMLMKAFIINMVNNHESVVATRHVIESIKKTGTKLEPIILPATIPSTIKQDLDNMGLSDLQYTYPRDASQDGLDMRTGLRLSHYPTNNLNNRIACRDLVLILDLL
jgi:hypothetical protein